MTRKSQISFADPPFAVAPDKPKGGPGGARHRRKGDRIERELVELHRGLGIKAERYPLSGASRFRGSGHDVDIYALGAEAAPLVAEVKGRKNGAGFTTLEKWLGEFDLLAKHVQNLFKRLSFTI